ncbi:unnamed protein product [Paramecium sonneborni]|uniref:Uncharacterized protein n=1 Tax=Paramecium sonneborni TaxID=65129 RepID=A0A8S1R0V7_9CILI|nr:unnamed protein product [Paramecium sonneborni]
MLKNRYIYCINLIQKSQDHFKIGHTSYHLQVSILIGFLCHNYNEKASCKINSSFCYKLEWCYLMLTNSVTPTSLSYDATNIFEEIINLISVAV